VLGAKKKYIFYLDPRSQQRGGPRSYSIWKGIERGEGDVEKHVVWTKRKLICGVSGTQGNLFIKSLGILGEKSTTSYSR